MRVLTGDTKEPGDVGFLGCLVALLGAVALVISTTLPWASWNIGSDGVSRTLQEMPLIPDLLVLGALVVAGSAVAGLAGSVRAVEVGGHVAVAITLFATLFLVLAGTVTTVLPVFHLPSTAQRLALGTAAGPGPWLALGAGSAVAVVSIPSLRRHSFALLARVRAEGPLAVLAVAVFAGAIPALALLRAATWVVAELPGGKLNLSGETLGLVTLAAPLLLAPAIYFVCLGRVQLGALVAAFAGWVANVSAGFSIVFSEALAQVHVRGAHAVSAAWITYFTGFLVAAAAAAVLWQVGRR